MKINIKIEGGVIQWQNAPDGFKDGVYEVEIKNTQSRTSQQNAALHLWMTQIANTLNTENIPTTQILKADIHWDLEKVKHMIVRPLIQALFGTTTTTKLKKDDFELMINALTKMMGQKGIIIPEFPNNENRHKTTRYV